MCSHVLCRSLNPKKLHDFGESSSDDVSPIKILGVSVPSEDFGLGIPRSVVATFGDQNAQAVCLTSCYESNHTT